MDGSTELPNGLQQGDGSTRDAGVLRIQINTRQPRRRKIDQEKSQVGDAGEGQLRGTQRGDRATAEWSVVRAMAKRKEYR